MKKLLFIFMLLAAVLGLAGTGSFAMLNDSESATASFTAGTWGPIPVTIDIKPGSFPNSINPNANGVIPVAILNTLQFDPTTVNPDSAQFGPHGAWAVQWAIQDVNHDGYPDMILHFGTQDTGIKAGDTEAALTGLTLNGRDFEGSDSVKTTP